MSVGELVDPYPGFRFHVEIDSLFVAGFSEVTGLEVEVETEEYEEGGVNHHTHVLPKRVSYSNVTLKRGLTDFPQFTRWIDEAIRGPAERKTGHIFLQDASGRIGRGWEFVDGYPVRWEGPDLAADQASVAIESLEIAHQGLNQIDIG